MALIPNSIHQILISCRKKREERTIHYTFPHPSISLADGTLRFGGLLDLSFLKLYQDISSIGVEGLPPALSWYVRIAIGNEFCYCCVDLWHTSLKFSPLLSRGALSGYWPLGSTDTASLRESCSLLVLSKRIFLAVSRLVFQAIILIVRSVRLMRNRRSLNA